MADQSLSSASATAKKKTKKKKRKTGVGESDSPESPQEQSEKYPKQTTDQEEPVIATAKCTFCGKTVRQLVRGTKTEGNRIVTCDACLKLGIPSDGDVVTVMDGYLTPRAPVKENLCNCTACVNKRENAVPPEVERDAHITQSYWMEIRHVVRCIYRDSMNLAELSTKENIGSEKMRGIVKKLCSRDPHQFFQRLETLAREYLLEVKVRLLEQLSCGFNSPQLAIEFIQMLLDEYSTLCSALPGLLFLLEPLESTDYVRRLGVTIELVNKNIFRELIFAESFMSSNLPLIIAQLRLASLSSDPFHRSTADSLSKSYISLDREMEDIGKVWKVAKEQLRVQHQEMKMREDRQREQRQSTLAKIKAESEMLRKEQQTIENDDYTTEAIQATGASVKLKDKPVQATEEQSKSQTVPAATAPVPTATESGNTKPKTSTHLTSLIPSSSSSPPSTHQQQHESKTNTEQQQQPQEKSIGSWLTKEQVAEFSKILFKCIKPIGEPEFRITDDIATHTITLKIDMTAIDLRHAEALCTREQVQKYEQLGLRREEIAEVALKLNAIKHLGINLRIDDLFDEHGFMVVDGNETHEEREDAVYFVEDGRNSIRGKEKLIQEELARSELVDLRPEKQKVIERENSDVGEGRETDLLQSMTMKIRFMKSVVNEEVRSRLVSDSEQVMFESCDQVQMKLTQLELNTVRLMCASTSLAANLGMINKPRDTGAEKFLHTDAHQPFVDLLLEQGKATTEQAKRAAAAASKEEKSNVAKEENKKSKQHKEESHSVAAVHPVETTPSTLTIPIRTQSCQCFACIGAVAAQQTEGISRPLNPIDPSGSKLTIKDVLVAGLEECSRSSHFDGRDFSAIKVSNKTENLWQNWMSSTSDSLEDDKAIQSTATSSSNNTSTSVSSNNAAPPNNTTASTTAAAAPHANHTHSCEATPNSSAAITESTQTSASNGNAASVRRYCPCCYCELFGHNSPITVPTSHNYTKVRDKMRQKLEKKRSKRDGEHIHQCPHGYSYPVPLSHSHPHPHPHPHPHEHHPLPAAVLNHQQLIPHHRAVNTAAPETAAVTVNPTPPPPVGDERSLDELLMFIEGKDFVPSSSTGATTAKAKKKNKKKKVTDPVSPVEETQALIGNGIAATNGPAPSSPITTTPVATATVTVASNDQEGKDKLSHVSNNTKKGAKDKPKPLPSQPLKQTLSNGSNKKGHPVLVTPASPSLPLSQQRQYTQQQQQSPKPSRNKLSKRTSHQSNGHAKGYSERSMSGSVSERMPSDGDGEEDYDQELEDFKKLCFSSAPVDARKKLHVSLNMQDIISKMK